MTFPSKIYRVSFNWQGKDYWETVLAWSNFYARQLIEARYPGALVNMVTEE